MGIFALGCKTCAASLTIRQLPDEDAIPPERWGRVHFAATSFSIPSADLFAASPDRLAAVQCPNEHDAHVAKIRPALTQQTFPRRFRLREMLPDFRWMIWRYALFRQVGCHCCRHEIPRTRNDNPVPIVF